MILILKELRTYLENEGLSEFLPKATRNLNLSTPWIVAHVLLAIILTLPNQTALLGAPIPIFTIMFFLTVDKIYTSYKSKRKNKKQNRVNTAIHPLTEAFLLFIYALVNGVFIGLLVKNWSATLIFISFSLFITFTTNRILKSNHVLLDLFQQTLKGLVSSWQAVLTTIPVLVITIFLSLFSEDVWNLTDSLTWQHLCIISALVFTVLFIGTKINKVWIKNQVLYYFDSPEKITARVFGFPVITKLKQGRYISIEDEEDVLDYLKWRDINNTAKKELDKLSTQIERRHSLTILLTTLLLGFILFIILTTLFVLLSPALLRVGWIQTSGLLNIQGLTSILKLSYLISTLQMAAFLGSLSEQSRENIIAVDLLEKSTDWVSAIMVFHAISTPASQLWSIKTETQGIFKKWEATIGNIIVKEGLSSKIIEQICKDIETIYVTQTDKVEFKVFNNRTGLVKEIKSGKDNFNWHYIHDLSSNHTSFSAISESIDFSSEEHLLGRDCQKQGKTIPDNWFGNTPITVAIGRAIWDLDDGHHYVMHPFVWKIKDKEILNIEIRLLKQLPNAEDYGLLVNNSLLIAKNILGELGVVNIFFPYRYEEKWICDFQLTKDKNILYTKDGKTTNII